MASIPLVQSVTSSENEFLWRCVDISERIWAGLLFLALIPVLAALWLAFLFVSGRPPLIAHRRIGLNGSELWVIKFRTMWEGRRRLLFGRALSVEHIDDQTGPGLKGPDDFRVGGQFAMFCRRHSLDELPQLIHVVQGRMSLVGPRPVTPAELNQIYGAHAAEILRRKPGISGLWQVSGRNRLTPEERRRIDCEYVRKRSLGLYFRILLRTIPEVFSGVNAW